MTATDTGCASSTHEDKLREFGRRVVAAARRLFAADIIDPSAHDLVKPPAGASQRVLDAHTRAVWSREFIDDMLRACGWTDRIPYAGNRRGPEWCGIFAAKCYREAGFDPSWLAHFFPSTIRLYNLFHYRDWNEHRNPKPASGPHRIAVKVDGKLPDGFVMPEGAIVVVGDGTPSAGDHITIGVRVTATGIVTISGNGGGIGPDGRHREGVVEREFPFAATSGYRVLWIYFPAPGDLL